MSTNSNANAASGATGEFHASRPRDEPLTTSGHQPGQIVSEADAAPEFHAQTLPPGSAPAKHTFAPNATADAPAASGAPKGSTTTAASGSMTGATSGDVHAGLGKPIQGQSAADVKHDSKRHGGAGGLAGVTAAGRGGSDEP